MSAPAFDGPTVFFVVVGKLLLASLGLGLGAIAGLFVAGYLDLLPAIGC